MMLYDIPYELLTMCISRLPLEGYKVKRMVIGRLDRQTTRVWKQWRLWLKKFPLAHIALIILIPYQLYPYTNISSFKRSTV